MPNLVLVLPLCVLQPGDVLVMGSDGLFDNLWEEDLEEIVHSHMQVCSWL